VANITSISQLQILLASRMARHLAEIFGTEKDRFVPLYLLPPPFVLEILLKFLVGLDF